MAIIPISATFAGQGSLRAHATGLLNISTIFPGFIGFDTIAGRGGLTANLSQTMAISASLQGTGLMAPVDPIWMQADFIWPGIVVDAGSHLLYRQAAGLEKALADVDGYRLTQTYVELIKDQWDPYKISSTNLPYLAWATGVNLWEDTWPEAFKRWWIAQQWTYKYERGSAKGLIDFINTVNVSPGFSAEVVNLTTPPASFFPGATYSDAERAAYVARFPQLRLYPYAPRPQLPYLNYLGGSTPDQLGRPKFVKNGRFFGPLVKFYPTNFNAGGLYLRQCTVYDPLTGIETNCTVRTIVSVNAGTQQSTTYDQIALPAIAGNLFYPGAGNKKYFFPPNTPITQDRTHSIVLGVLPYTPSRMVLVPRDGTLDITQYQAIFQTIVPSLNPINVRPEYVYQQHLTRKAEWYCGMPLRGMFNPPTNAWQFLYERWYLFDPTRQPDPRIATSYMGRARFGIPKYTAQVKIKASFIWPKFYYYAGGFIGKGFFFPPQNTKLIDQIRRAVVAAMAERDTVLIDTNVERIIQIRDLTILDGRFTIGQYITDIT